MKHLLGHESEETAYLIKDYPWGFHKRTQVKCWIEKNKNGWRFVKTTKHPDKGHWCKPKKTTYSKTPMVLFLDENNHIQHEAVAYWAELSELEEWKKEHGKGLGLEELSLFDHMIKRAKERLDVSTN